MFNIIIIYNIVIYVENYNIFIVFSFFRYLDVINGLSLLSGINEYPRNSSKTGENLDYPNPWTIK